MKFTFSWLKDHLETGMRLDELTDALTRTGLEVESVSNPAELLQDFVIAKVTETKPHPNADKLKLCTVDTGTDTMQVVCGAPNAKAGMKGVFAPSGTYIPGADFTLKPVKIRGVESNGMLCSERELMISDEHEGIIELDADAPVGENFASYRGLNDPVIEVAITPNRQDCLGVRGIARDLAAAGLGTLKADTTKPVKGTFKSDIDISLDFDKANKNTCPLFLGRLIRGVKNGPSPQWLQNRLRAIGLRPISALVDITNFITYDRARPLHVYDVAKVNGHIHARIGKKGESLLALDGRTYTLKGGECVIADDKTVLGFGGVMGGEESGCTENTTDVFIEAALFDPIRTAETGRQHNIDSDARYRFERGVDPEAVFSGMEYATNLVLELCGGKPSEIVVAGKVPDWQRNVPFHPERVQSLGGLDVPEKESITFLKALGFNPEKTGNAYTVAVPSWRTDVEGEADLVEDILRMKGYDCIPAVPLAQKPGVPDSVLTTQQVAARSARRALAHAGLLEAITYSFMKKDLAKAFGGGDNTLTVANPISSELDQMRPSILPNLLEAAARNLHRGQKTVALFEVGPQYTNDTPEGQSLVAAGIRAGLAMEKHWAEKQRPVDGFDAKADALTALHAAGAPVDNLQTFEEAPSWYHPGRSGTLRLGPKNILAAFGEIHPTILKKMGIKGRAAGFEVYLETVPSGRKTITKTALQANDLQSVERDFAFLMDKDIAVETLLRAIKGADKAHIRAVRVFDVFEGGNLPKDKKSVAISVSLEPQHKTFSDEEIESIARKVLQAAEKTTGATLRQ